MVFKDVQTLISEIELNIVAIVGFHGKSIKIVVIDICGHIGSSRTFFKQEPLCNVALYGISALFNKINVKVMIIFRIQSDIIAQLQVLLQVFGNINRNHAEMIICKNIVNARFKLNFKFIFFARRNIVPYGSVRPADYKDIIFNVFIAYLQKSFISERILYLFKRNFQTYVLRNVIYCIKSADGVFFDRFGYIFTVITDGRKFVT